MYHFHFTPQKSLIRSILGLFKKQDSEFIALNKINLDIKKGEIIGIIGTNGCGKSTLLRIISGIYFPDLGHCKVKGNISLLAGLGNWVFRSSDRSGKCHPVWKYSGLLRGKKINKLPEIISFSELGEFIDQPIRTYSAGMKARLGLAVASAIQPEILLIDEVLGVGDPTFKEKSTNRIMEMVQDAGTVVIVSHSFGMLSKICDRIVLMEKGEIIDEGEPRKVIQTYYNRARRRKSNEGSTIFDFKVVKSLLP